MSNSNITKKAIASTMKELMKKVSFDSITTNEIMEKCGISRKTFYYHFQDKYDLVNWIFSTEIIDGILSSTTLDNWVEGSLKLCHYVKDNKAFYTNAINASGQNCFVEFLYSLTERQVTILSKEANNNKALPQDDLKFLINFYYNAFIGVFTAWLKDDMKDSPEIIVQRWSSVVDKTLEHYVNNINRVI